MITFYYAPGSRTIKAFHEAVSSDLLQHIDMVQAFKDTKPRLAHVVLVAGEGRVPAEVERFAASRGAFPVCVPEASTWLTAEIRRRLADEVPFVMVDGTLATTKQLSGAR